jgi:FAD/FMN-containing dehydrogenase
MRLRGGRATPAVPSSAAASTLIGATATGAFGGITNPALSLFYCTRRLLFVPFDALHSKLDLRGVAAAPREWGAGLSVGTGPKFCRYLKLRSR